jgi:hypothetical protein
VEVLAALVALAWILGKETMGLLTTKDDVTLTGLAPEGFTIAGAIERATRVFGVNLVITSAVRAEDSDSMHSLGKALDVRTSSLTSEEIIALYWWFTVELGSSFVVLFETNSPASLPSELRAIAYYNPSATGNHFHLGVRRT